MCTWVHVLVRGLTCPQCLPRAQGWVQGCRSGGWGGAGPLPGSGAADLSIGDWEQRSRMSHPNGRLSQVPHPCPIHGGLFGINPVAGAPMIGVTASQGGAQHAHPAQDLIHGAGCSPGRDFGLPGQDFPNGARCSRSALKLKCSKLISHEDNQHTPKRCWSWHPPVKSLLMPRITVIQPLNQMVLAVSEAQETLPPCRPWSTVSGEGPLGGPGHLN